MRWLGLLLLLTSLSPSVFAQSEGALFDQVSSLRRDIERLDDARTSVNGQRETLSRALDSLALQIEKRKQDHPEGGLLPDLTLQQMLRQSQEISERITAIQQELDSLAQARAQRLQTLVGLYDRLVDQTAAAVRSGPEARRSNLLQVLNRIRREREELRRASSPRRESSVRLANESWLAAEDPEELAERADAVRDEQDRLRRRLALLDKRLTDLQADNRLDRELRDFQTDQNLFGEETRTLRFSQTSSATSAKTDDPSPGAGGTQDNEYGNPVGEDGRSDWADPDLPAGAFNGGECSGGQCGTPAEPEGPETITLSGQTPLQLDPGDVPRDLDPASELRLLGEQRRQFVERIKRLQVLHDRLREKADALSAP